MDTLADYLIAIRGVYPNLRIEPARVLASCEQSNDVVCGNEALVFRFPRTMQGVQRIPLVTAVLRGLQGRTLIPTPRPIYRSKELRTVGQAFSGYPMLRGEVLQAETLAGLSAAAVQDLAEQAAHFLRELHSVPREMLDITLYLSYGLDYWRQVYHDVQQRLFPDMSTDARVRARAHFEGFLDDPHAFDFRPALIHGDFAPNNILWAPESGEITGVLDFDDTAWSDPAIDVASMAHLGEAFMEGMESVYPEIRNMTRRTDFYRGALELREALRALPGQGDSAA